MVEYDVVLLNGRVMDPETMYDKISNVGITEDRIAVITKDQISGKTTIDCTGHVVSPGFIDTHVHWIYPLGSHISVLDGRTSIFELEYGCAGSKVDEWYKSREGKLYCNYGTGSSHEHARAAVLDGFTPAYGDGLDGIKLRGGGSGWSSVKPDFDQLDKILEIVDLGLQAGAVGVSSTLGYMRDGVSSREAFELVKVGAAYNRPTAMHFRGTPGTEVAEVNGIQELLCNAVAMGAPAIACHFNNPGYNLVHEMICRLQEQGHNVWGEIYPYAAGATTINAVFLRPEIWVEQVGHKYEDTLQDAETGTFYTKESYVAMREKNPTKLVNVFKMPEECEKEWIQLRNATVASDGMPIVVAPFAESDVLDVPYADFPNTHPRLAGTYSKSLRLARENNVPLMHMISMCSYTSAMRLGKTGLKSMAERGRIQVGKIADITVFNPDTVTDNSTYASGSLPPTGIPYVLCNGRLVVNEGKIVPKAYVGRPLRHEPISRRLSEPLDIEKWKHVYTTAAKVDFGGSDPNQSFCCP